MHIVKVFSPPALHISLSLIIIFPPPDNNEVPQHISFARTSFAPLQTQQKRDTPKKSDATTYQ